MTDLNTTAVAWRLSVSRQSIWRWRKQKLLHGYVVGANWRISKDELAQFRRRRTAMQDHAKPQTFRSFAVQILGRSSNGLRSLERRLGAKITPGMLAQLLRNEGREAGRQEMYCELRLQRRLKYPEMSAAAKRRYSRDNIQSRRWNGRTQSSGEV